MRDGRLRQLASLPSPQSPRLVETNQRPPSQLFRLAVDGLQSHTMALYEPSHATRPKKRRVSAWISARSYGGSQQRQRAVRLVERAFFPSSMVAIDSGRRRSTVDNSAAASAKRAGGGGVLSTTSKELAPAAMSAKDEWTAKVNAKGDEVRKAKAAKADK